jgi:hypothetical protein
VHSAHDSFSNDCLLLAAYLSTAPLSSLPL